MTIDDAVKPARRGARSLLWPALATLAGFAVLMGLGFWQIERMGAKQRLIHRVEQSVRGAPQVLPPESAWATLRPKSYEYRKVRVEGRFLHDKEIHVHGLLSPERPGGQVLQGVYVLTPLQLDDGAVIYVNRGFVPTEKTDQAARREGLPEGRVAVTGLLRAPEPRGWFLPDDDPAKNSWFVRDPLKMARLAGLTRAAPFVLDADATPNQGGWPLGGQTRLTFPNDHLQYAITWFALAAGLLVVFAFFARQQTARGHEDGGASA
ncbi:SURF1 family protein [Alsobacter sp. SYSU M60028]|uniref:SURF1-like protein n=1 Tax=Alsobacter ponti TaxID=2962936 RepID=A0ABT1LCK8_9HYPH|nr:SURF1 family protein [Alsobacter ponti]MCP8939237.1 SURF1 family protein [Alsobacter ponti]